LRPDRSASQAAEVHAAEGPEPPGFAAGVETDGGTVLARYNDPFGGKPLLPPRCPSTA
jgi:hypothetical protein